MKLVREDLLSFACDDKERSIARHIPKAAIKHLSRFPTRAERQFAFRYFWVPFEKFAVCEKVFLSPAACPRTPSGVGRGPFLKRRYVGRNAVLDSKANVVVTERTRLVNTPSFQLQNGRANVRTFSCGSAMIWASPMSRPATQAKPAPQGPLRLGWRGRVCRRG